MRVVNLASRKWLVASRCRRGFTLIELLVYMAILGFIVVVAGQVFSDSTVMRIRSQNMLRVSEEVGRVANIIREDVSQMGAKTWGENGTVYIIKSDKPEVYIHSADSSSFMLYKNVVTSAADNDIEFDSLMFRTISFGQDGEFLAVREITWATNAAGELRRYCKTLNGTDEDGETCPSDRAEPVLIAENVKKFSFFPSAPGKMPNTIVNTQADIKRDTIFPLATGLNPENFALLTRVDPTKNLEDIDLTNSGKESTTSFLANNETSYDVPKSSDSSNEVYLTEYTNTSNDYTECLLIPMRAGETYVVEFNMLFPDNGSTADQKQNDSLSSQFVPGVDHIAVGLRTNEGNPIPAISPDVLLYAPQAGEANNKPRYAEFTANDKFDENLKVCTMLTFSFYSPTARKGKLVFRDFKVYKKQTGTYHFVKEENNYDEGFAKEYAAVPSNTPAKLSQKRNVKAFELLLEIDRNGEVAGTYSKGSVGTKGNSDFKGPTGMAIPVPNNGVTSL